LKPAATTKQVKQSTRETGTIIRFSSLLSDSRFPIKMSPKIPTRIQTKTPESTGLLKVINSPAFSGTKKQILLNNLMAGFRETISPLQLQGVRILSSLFLVVFHN
jgi:hypothetical protein